jgi:hypothetical protein
MAPLRLSQPWPEWFQHHLPHCLPKPVQKPRQLKLVEGLIRPVCRPAIATMDLKVDAGGYAAMIARLFSGYSEDLAFSFAQSSWLIPPRKTDGS